jgi:hypothetical protein
MISIYEPQKTCDKCERTFNRDDVLFYKELEQNICVCCADKLDAIFEAQFTTEREECGDYGCYK